MAKSTTDLNITCSQALTNLTADITQALVAVSSAHTSDTAPTYNVEDGMLWLDNTGTDYILKMSINSAWVTLMDLTGGVFATLGENILKTRIDGHDDKHDGTTLSSPDFTGTWKINDIAVTSTAAELNYSTGVTSDIQDQIDATPTPYTHPTTTGNVHLPAGGATANVLEYLSEGTAQWASPSPAVVGTDSVGQSELKTSQVVNQTFTSYAHQDTGTYRKLPQSQYGYYPQIIATVDPYLNWNGTGWFESGDIGYVDPASVSVGASFSLENAVFFGSDATSWNSYIHLWVHADCQMKYQQRYGTT